MNRHKIVKEIWILILLTLALTLLTACGGGDAEEYDAGSINNDIIETYIYLPTHIALPEIVDRVGGVQVYGDRIFFSYVEHDTANIVITSMLADGSNQQRTAIPTETSNVHIAGFRITDEGHFAFLIANDAFRALDMPASAFAVYAEYDSQGREIVSQDLTNIIYPDPQGAFVSLGFFTDEGNIVLGAQEDGKRVFHLFDSERTHIGRLETGYSSQAITQLQDGRVVVLKVDWDSYSHELREIDFAAGDWGETFPLTANGVRNLFPARSEEPFDLLIDDGSHLIGYVFATGEQTPLLNWIEAGLAAQWGYQAVFLPDGSISVLVSDWGGDGGDWRTELITMVRTVRAALPEPTVITLGGMWIDDEVRTQVVAFNEANGVYQIQIQEYFDPRDPAADWETSNLRFLMDIVTGQGPDIIFDPPTAMIGQGFLVDLYPFLDADPVLNRTDFFSNILQAMEAPDGSLPMIADRFNITTMIGTVEAAGHIQSWTFSDLLTFLEEADDMRHVLADYMTGERFLSMALALSGSDFIDWVEGGVHLESDAFVHLLEIAARLPRIEAGDPEIGNELSLMLSGEMSLAMSYIFSPARYQEFVAVLDEFVVLGMPTPTGGVHRINPIIQFSINASSANPDGAWNFIRQFLLSDVPAWSIPLRIDVFEAHIAEAMTPIIEVNADGNEIERPRGTAFLDAGRTIDFFAMTEEEAAGFRAIVEGPVQMQGFDETIEEMIAEEVLPFFSGDRSAADTARILQNRVHTFVQEQRR